jgi:hypothetical protein
MNSQRIRGFASTRRAAIFIATIAVAACTASITSSVRAALTLNVSGVTGSGFTSWVLSGSSTAIQSGTIRTSLGSANFLIDDTFEPDFTGNFLLPSSIQDTLFPIIGPSSGPPSVTVGSDTVILNHIFLDEDGAERDDIGIRTVTSLQYAAGESSSWSGTFTLELDIDKFIPGTYRLNSTQANGGGFLFAGVNDVILNFAVVPEPSSLSLALLSLIGLRQRIRYRY